MELSFRNLELTDVASLEWSGSTLHLDYISKQILKMETGDVEVVACLLDGEIIAKGQIDYGQYRGFGTIGMVNVKPEYQGKGIGSKLFLELERRSSAKGINKFRLHVEKTNTRAKELYILLGYIVIGDVLEEWDQFDEHGQIEKYQALCDLMEKNLANV